MVRFGLNTRKANNYAFFCPVSRLHLTRSNPIGVADGVTPAILRGLRTKVILDLEDKVDLETGTLKTEQTPPPAEPPELSSKSEGNDVAHEEQPKSGRGRRKKAVNDAENGNFTNADAEEAPTEEEAAE